jgi:hypothetical protein
MKCVLDYEGKSEGYPLPPCELKVWMAGLVKSTLFCLPAASGDILLCLSSTSSKRRTLPKLHGVTTKNIVLFIAIVVRNTNPTSALWFSTLHKIGQGGFFLTHS